MEEGLNRFLSAQEKSYKRALQEICSGKKMSHWMWYIFPQIQGHGNAPSHAFGGNLRRQLKTLRVWGGAAWI